MFLATWVPYERDKFQICLNDFYLFTILYYFWISEYVYTIVRNNQRNPGSPFRNVVPELTILLNTGNRTRIVPSHLAPHSHEARLILRAISFLLFHLTSRKRTAKWPVLWQTKIPRAPGSRDSFFPRLSRYWMVMESYDCDLWTAVTLRGLRNFGFMVARRLIVRHRQWTAKCTGGGASLSLPPPSSSSSLHHRVTLPERKKLKSHRALFQCALPTTRMVSRRK